MKPGEVHSTGLPLAWSCWSENLAPTAGSLLCLQMVMSTELDSHRTALNLPVGEFPGGPVVKTLCSQYKGPGFNSWSGN